MRRAPLTAGIATVVVAAVAAAYPVPRPGHEREIAWRDATLMRGPWIADGGGLRLEHTERARNVVLVPFRGASFLRLRARAAAGTWVAILFRAEVAVSRPLRLRGYGLAVNTRKGRLELMRFDEGGVRDPGAVAAAEVIELLDDFELCLWQAGASFAAALYDGVTKLPIATLAWSDPSYADGAVGLQVAGRGAERVHLTLSAAPVERPPSERPWLAEQWLVLIDQDELATVPQGFDGQLRRLRSHPEDATAYATREETVFALRESGVRLRAAQPGVPFRFRDPGYNARAAASLRRTRSGIAFQEGLKDHDQIAAHLKAYAERFPEQTRLEELGRSVEGRPIHALRIADDPDDPERPVLLLVAAHHANEAITPELVLDAVRYLLENPRDRQVRAWLASLAVVAVPMVNPDGSHAFWHLDDQLGRTNRRLTNPEEPRTSGVDLNRNYPFRWGEVEARYSSSISSTNFFRGEAAGSEPEVAAMLRLGEREQPLAVISYHAAATKLLVSYTSGDQPNPDPSVSWLLAEEIVAGMTHSFRGRQYEARRNLYAVTGTDQNWYLHAFGSVAYILEAPYSTPVRLDRIRDVVENSRYAWQYLLDRWLAGPSLSVRAVAAGSGAPLAAVVTVDEMTLGAGERWSARADTGWFHRYLPGEGTYTVRVTHGDVEAVEAIVALEGVTTVEVEL